MTRRVAMAAVVMAVAVGCAAESATPSDRAVSITTTACGHASRTSGAGVVVEDGWAVASAHVVSGAGSVTVSGPFGSEPAEIVVVDRVADLALLRVPSAEATAIEFAAGSEGDTVRFGGGGPSGALDASILRAVDVRIEAVRSSERISRVGYELNVRVALGDSGGGVFDGAGRLIGVVFGRPLDDRERTFIVRSEEVEALLEADRAGSWVCNPDEHEVQAQAG